MGPAPSSPPLLHKSARSCQICLKFGCMKQSAGAAEEVVAPEQQLEVTGQIKCVKVKWMNSKMHITVSREGDLKMHNHKTSGRKDDT